MKTIGDRLKQIREEAGLTKKDIAEMLGIQLPVYIGIEENKVDLTLKHIKTLKKGFDISIDWLITGVENKSDFDNFGKYKGAIKEMLHDMESDVRFLHGMFIHYYKMRLKIFGIGPPIPPVAA
jgi:transcriptional regulator with XRE-family HTH domain